MVKSQALSLARKLIRYVSSFSKMTTSYTPGKSQAVMLFFKFSRWRVSYVYSLSADNDHRPMVLPFVSRILSP